MQLYPKTPRSVSVKVFDFVCELIRLVKFWFKRRFFNLAAVFNQTASDTLIKLQIDYD